MAQEKKLEKDIQREICEWLEFMGLFFWRSNNIPVFGQNNAGYKTFRKLPKFTPRGLPDIIVLHQGQFHGIEVKRPGQKLRPEQIDIAKKIRDSGCNYHLVFSLEEVQTISAFYLPREL